MLRRAFTMSARPSLRQISPRQVSSLAPSVSAGMGNSAAASLHRFGVEVALVPCLDDNYCPIVHHSASGATLIVDTPDASPIVAALNSRGWKPTHILNTHHHGDHVGGNLELKNAFPDLCIVGPRETVYEYPGPYPPPGMQTERIPGIDKAVQEGDELKCGGLTARILEVGGHTATHIAYHFSDVSMVLAGDCLFTMGCGRVFTGDFALMYNSLQKFRALPDETVVYCAHEYTPANVKFALQVEPNNLALQERAKHVATLRTANEPTVPTLMAHEKATNPFLRWDSAEIKQSLGHADDLATFTAVRRWKDTGKKPDARTAARSKL